MAELADAHGSGPCESNFMGVQVPLPAERISRDRNPFLLYRKLLRNSYKAKKPSGGCALAREEIVAIATALGASVLRAERFLVPELPPDCKHFYYNSSGACL